MQLLSLLGDRQSLRARAIIAALWSTGFSMLATVLRFGSSLIMTRLLVPEIFGVVALSGVVFAVVSLLSDIGLRQCVIQNRDGGEQFYLDTVWTISALRGVFITFITVLVAVVLWYFADVFPEDSVYRHPDLPLVLALTSISSLWMGIKSPKLYLLERNLDFRTAGYVEVIAQAVSTVCVIALTLKWRTVWPIVIGSHISTITVTLLSWYWVPGPIGKMTWNRSVVKQVVDYGRWILLSSVAYVIASAADRLMLGLWITPAELGFYVLALNILQAAESIVTRPFTSVGLPAFSELARDAGRELRRVYRKFRLPLDIALVTTSGGMFAGGNFLIDLVYDPRYAAAGRILTVLSVSLLLARYVVVSTVHAALGEPQTSSWMNVTKLVSIIVCIPVGHHLGGLEGAMWAIALHMVPSTMVALWRNAKHGLNDFGYEALVLLPWPVGYLLAKAGIAVLRMVGL